MTVTTSMLARPLAFGRVGGLASALSLFMAFFVPLVSAAETPTVQPGKGWRYRVAIEKLPDVDDLSIGPDGVVYATQELADSKGRVIRLRNGQAEVVLDGLERPGGIYVKRQGLYVSEQLPEGRVIKFSFKDGHRRVSEGLRNPEHINALPEGDIVVTEDNLYGRLIRLSGNGTNEVITSGFNDVNGLSVARDGTIYIGESGTGRVLSFSNGVLNVVVDDLDALGQIDCASDGTIWITENSESGRLLRFKDGVLETVLSGLSNPQGVAAHESGAVFIAERGRSRILMAEPKPPVEPRP